MSIVERIEEIHLDLLREVANIGAGHAATALSQLLNKTIDMKVPSVEIVPFNKIGDAVGGEDKVVAGIFLRIEGEAPGNMFFMMPVDEASKLIQQLLGNPTVDFLQEEPDELGVSALNEIGNILAGSYLSALADLTKLNLQPSPPSLAVDMFMAILSHGLYEISKVGDFAILIDTEIMEKEDQNLKTTGHFFLLPDPDSFEKIFKSQGVNVE